MTDGCVHLLNNRSWNSITSQLCSFCQGNRYGMEKAGGMACLSHTKSHLPAHSPPASQAGLRAHLCRPLNFEVNRSVFADFLCRPAFPVFLHEPLPDSFLTTQYSTEDIYRVFIKQTGNFGEWCKGPFGIDDRVIRRGYRGWYEC
jgi:hypothetical protein